MPEKKEDSSNGYSYYKQLPAWERMLVDIARTFGVPTLLLLALCYWFFWQVTPPTIDAMSRFVTATLETQAELAKTQADIAESQRSLVKLVEEVSIAANEIVKAEQATQIFMQTVEESHALQLEKLENIEKAVSPQTQDVP